MVKRKKQKPVPLAPPPQMKSRKKARKVTSLFHKLTRDMDEAKAKNNLSQVESIQQQIHEMGGREEYQRASQLSTSFHSTSRWVLKVLIQKGWSCGIHMTKSMNIDEDKNDGTASDQDKVPVNILEVGAINTELLDAANKTRRVLAKKDKNNNSNEDDNDQKQKYKDIPLYNINCRAIDLRSSHERIEEQNFLSMPLPKRSPHLGAYHVIVCSMVLNCVTTAEDRGKMLCLLYHQLKPGGLCFFTIPKLCLQQSKYINRQMFEELLVDGIGFKIENKKETPKVAFWILKRPKDKLIEDNIDVKVVPHKYKRGREAIASHNKDRKWKETWETTRIINRGKKFRNEFAVIITKDMTSR
uniref:Uncharacterized protein n=1 Tax=Chaetoceros debilis TaxID=122233 RepID=A0A7S3VGQ2_9STRA|mmetsp:Transcript_6612/g.9676  ORF Transcript_6612/g.9676 Transcript_6612/m.9676 type:complete len:356 (-) Transcript_6612:10-1077(-)